MPHRRQQRAHTIRQLTARIRRYLDQIDADLDHHRLPSLANGRQVAAGGGELCEQLALLAELEETAARMRGAA